MDWKKEGKILLAIGVIFAGFFYLPLGEPRFDNAVFEALYLTKWYAQEHVILCLLPAFFIAGAISVFISQQSVMKYLGAKANKFLAYGVASVSGGILAVCSCTVLPLFAGIYKMGAGLGPATTFLYSGPAINVMAVILTANVLGIELGIARALGAVVFSIIIGVLMQFIYRKEELEKANGQIAMPDDEGARPLWKNVIYFGLMVAILIFSNWGNPDNSAGIWAFIHSIKWYLTGAFALGLLWVLLAWFEINKKKLIIVSVPVLVLAVIFKDNPTLPFLAAIIGLSYVTATSKGEVQSWFESTWDFTKQIMPLLFYGVLIAGFALGRPGNEGIIPSEWINSAVGDNSIMSNLFASVVGAFMYFATLTEIPILQGLLGNGMEKGPALALLLSGPALSLPNMLVIKSVIGWRKTTVYILLVIIMSTISGLIYGSLF
ncbi:MAG: permease [Candidatus Kapaibacterium sp.]